MIEISPSTLPRRCGSVANELNELQNIIGVTHPDEAEQTVGFTLIGGEVFAHERLHESAHHVLEQLLNRSLGLAGNPSEAHAGFIAYDRTYSGDGIADYFRMNGQPFLHAATSHPIQVLTGSVASLDPVDVEHAMLFDEAVIDDTDAMMLYAGLPATAFRSQPASSDALFRPRTALFVSALEY